MKKMFNKKFFLILGSTVVLLIVLSVAMIFLTKENVKTFTKEGYIIASGKEESSKKYYFDEGTSYKKNISSQLVFTDTSGEKVTVETDNFMHYIDGGIKFLKNGVIMDLNSIESTTVPYYNITNKAVLEYNKKSYTIETIDKTLAFNNFAGRISENKYIFAGANIKLQLAGNEKIIEGDYFEINFIKDGIIKVENQEVSYQATAENSYILVDDNIRIDLGNKKIYLNDEEKMSLSQMTIDGNENIEIIPEDEEKDDEGNGDGEGTGEDQTGNEPGNQEENDGTNDGQQGNDNQENNEQPGEDGETTPGEENGDETDEPGEGDGTGSETGTKNERSASVDIVKAEVSANSINASFIINDPDNSIKGDLVLHITNTDTGKRVYSTVIDKTQPELNIGVSTLSPDSNYILSINEETNEEYDTQYFQKLFKTESLGITLEKKYITQESLAYEVIFGEESEVRSATITLYDEQYNPIGTSIVVTPESNIAYFEGLTSNTTYNIVLDNVIMDSLEFNDVYTIYKSTKTLKQTPYLEGLSTSVDDETNTFTVGVDRVVDIDESITKYSYYIYKAEDITKENIDTIKPVKIIEKSDNGKINIKIDNENILPKTNYKFKIVAEYYDNEKSGEFETELSDNFILSGKPKIEFIQNKQETSFNKIAGTIVLTDDSCTVPMYGRPCSSIKYHANNFSLEYKIINSSEKQILNDITFDTKTLEAGITIDNLLANTEYVFNLYGDVDLLDGKGLREGYLLGTFRASTSTIDILTVDWEQNEATVEDLINVSAKITATGDDENLGNSLANMTFNLYSGNVADQLKAGATIEPLATKQISGNLFETHFDKFFTINTLNTFGITDKLVDIIDEETGEVTGKQLIKAIDVLKSMTNDNLLKYYTIEITDVYDNDFKNELQIENNYYLFTTPPLFLMEYELEMPTITADHVENISLKTDTELADTLGTKYSNQLYDTTIVGYKVNAVASIDRMANYLPIKELIYYVCDADRNYNCTIDEAVVTKSIDVTQTSDLETTFFVNRGSNYNSSDSELARGHRYIFKLKFSVDTDNDGVADMYYPNAEVKTPIKSTPKQSPSYKMYIINTTENNANYKFNYFDYDNALYEQVMYYTIDDEFKNTIIIPEETPDDGEGDETTPDDSTEEVIPEEVPIEPEKPELEVKSIELQNCKSIRDPSTNRTNIDCDFSLGGLSTDSVYKILFKKALVKNSSNIVDEKVGEYIFDGKFTYDANTITFSNLTSENDNRLRIKINETNSNKKYVNRISAYKITLSAEGVDDYTRIYPSDRINSCEEEEDSYKCIIVDYAEIKEFKTKDISVQVTAYYDSGIIDNIFTTSNDNISSYLTNSAGYILQKNNAFNTAFVRANYITIADNNNNDIVRTSQYPIGIYHYESATRNKLKLYHGIDQGTFTFAENHDELDITLIYLNDAINTKDSGGNYQSINNKLLSTVDFGTQNNKFKFNSIIPKINVTYRGLVNGAVITIKPSGVDEEILKNEFKEEDGKYYFYLDIYKDEEKTEIYKQEKVEITIGEGSTIELTKYLPDTKYYFEVYAYLLKEKEYKKTRLFDTSSSSYATKNYTFDTLAPKGIYSNSTIPSATYRSVSETSTNTYLKRTLNLTMTAASSKIGTYQTRFELYDIDGNIVLNETVEPTIQADKSIKSIYTKDITPTEDEIKNEGLNGYVFGSGYYTMKVYIITEVDESEGLPDNKAELMIYETPITLKKLADPTYTVERTEGINSLTFKVNITDTDKVIENGEYCAVLLDSSQQPISGISPTCGISTLEKNKTITYDKLTSDTLYTFKIYSNVYTNNIDEVDKYRILPKNMLVSTSTNYGVALGLVTAYGSKSNVTLSFDSGVNIKNIKMIQYTLFEQQDKETGAVAIKSETYCMGTKHSGCTDPNAVSKNFSVSGTNYELIINPEGLSLSSGYSYNIDIAFWIDQNGTLVKLNNQNYTYGVKF